MAKRKQRALGDSRRNHVAYASAEHRATTEHVLNAHDFLARGDCAPAVKQAALALKASSRLMCHAQSAGITDRRVDEARHNAMAIFDRVAKQCMR